MSKLYLFKEYEKQTAIFEREIELAIAQTKKNEDEARFYAERSKIGLETIERYFLIPNYSKIVVYINMVNIRLKNVQLHLQERREKFNYENLDYFIIIVKFRLSRILMFAIKID